jgi:hypothetical protein
MTGVAGAIVVPVAGWALAAHADKATTATANRNRFMMLPPETH